MNVLFSGGRFALMFECENPSRISSTTRCVIKSVRRCLDGMLRQKVLSLDPSVYVQM
jgi:hypothetical protein